MRFRPGLLRQAAVFAAVFVAARVVYYALFAGAGYGGVTLLSLPLITLPAPFTGVHLLGPVTSGGLLTAALSALPFAAVILLFGLLSGSVMFWFTPLMNLFSRKHEYEADAFAREAVGGPGPLLGALRKLAQKNLSNLTPHRWFSAFYYSHPTLVEREAALVR